MGVGDQEMTVVVARFRAVQGRESDVAAILSRYVVMSRGHEGALNMDLLESEAEPNEFLVIQKWADEEFRDKHWSHDDAVVMAESVKDKLVEPPQILPFAPVSAYDLM